MALVTGGLAFAGVVVSNLLTNSKTVAIFEEKINTLRRDVSDLSEHVQKHNGLVERMVIEEQNTKALWRRVDEIREKLEDNHAA